MGSASCKALKESLVAAGVHCLQVKPDSRKFRPRRTDKYIYYGGIRPCNWDTPNTLNWNRGTATDKLLSFQRFTAEGLSTVEWTAERAIASGWLTQKQTVVARTLLSSHSGMGIIVCNNAETPLPTAPLYTKYLKKTFECRIHVMNGKVIDGQIKKKRTDAEANTLIRNAHTGWVYCREGYTPDEAAKQLAIAAVAALGLDFGAVDLIYNKHYNQYYLLEVNTAPGLTGTTLTNYTQEILKWFHS